ncbi:MAG: polysulfide reductase NrfD, partial [Eggerthellaceae bacterium]|nr:polysulfide reductase NrfD [Eggerthellaceae bacterium]
MLEKVLQGSKRYWAWVVVLLVIIGVGVVCYVNQLNNGLVLTGMSQDVNWGLYIAQFTFFVGVAASGVMIAIPLYLHDYKEYGPVLIFGEFMAVAAVLVALLSVIVDLGYPARIFNVLLYPTPHSILFWDMCVLSSYFIVNLLIGWASIAAERKGVKPAKWVHVLAIIAIPLAISIHTVTAFIYCGNPGRGLWSTAIIACRFLASAFAAGPALLLLITFIMRKFTSFKVSDKAIDTVAKTVAYAIIANVFFFMLEVFTSFYSNSPAHIEPMAYMLFGLEGQTQLVPFMWAAVVCLVVGVPLLLVKKWRRNHKLLVVALICVFMACWFDKGINFVLAGFVPNTFGEVVDYIPNINEILVIAGVFAIGALVLTLLFKVVLSVREELAQYDAVSKSEEAKEAAVAEKAMQLDEAVETERRALAEAAAKKAAEEAAAAAAAEAAAA